MTLHDPYQPHPEKSSPQDLGFGKKITSKKIGEIVLLKITTTDGMEYKLDPEHSSDVYRALFPDG